MLMTSFQAIGLSLRLHFSRRAARRRTTLLLLEKSPTFVGVQGGQVNVSFCHAAMDGRARTPQVALRYRIVAERPPASPIQRLRISFG